MAETLGFLEQSVAYRLGDPLATILGVASEKAALGMCGYFVKPSLSYLKAH